GEDEEDGDDICDELVPLPPYVINERRGDYGLPDDLFGDPNAGHDDLFGDPNAGHDGDFDGGGGGGGSVGTAEDAPNRTEKPTKERCAELAAKYGGHLNAQGGAFFSNRQDAQIAAILNAALGNKLSDQEPYEYGSLVLDAGVLWRDQGMSGYFVTPPMSNWMVGVSRTLGPDGPEFTSFDEFAWYQVAINHFGIGERADGVVGRVYPALLDMIHSHPTGSLFKPSGGDQVVAFRFYPTRQWIVDYDSGIMEHGMKGSPAEPWRRVDNSLVPQNDIQDMRACFGDGRL
ncbi:MAG: hypothetical protein ACREIA_18090, partial [Opitutaceae bacterium]